MKPIRIGITLGDINGIGPEVALKAAYGHRWPAHTRLVFIGSGKSVEKHAKKLGLPTPPAWNPGSPSTSRFKVVIWDPDPSISLQEKPGQIDPAASHAAATWIKSAVSACLSKSLNSIVTAPICKEGLQAAGINYPGHTEMLADLTKTKRFAMMLFGGSIRVVLVTRHVPIAEVSKQLTTKTVLEAIRITDEALPWLGQKKRRIAVCGLNPHAGDGGKIGREEITIIGPAIQKAKRAGLNVTGPIPADVVFHYVLKRKYDAVVAMYHDQGLAPMKMLAFDSGVNVTLGLPIIRTSPDHGTGFDIAGKNKANPQSMIEAIKWAIHLAQKKNPWRRS